MKSHDIWKNEAGRIFHHIDAELKNHTICLKTIAYMNNRMTPYLLPASRIDRSVSPCVSRRDEAMRRDGTMRRVDAMRQCDEMRRDRSETEDTAARISRLA